MAQGQDEAVKPDAFKNLADEFTLVSKDGIHWQSRRDYNWAQPHWHPEPPLFGYCQTSDAPTGFNRSIGSLDTHLTYSYDGQHFQRGARQALIGLNARNEIGGSALETSCMIETDSELRFYSDATNAQHGKGPEKGDARSGLWSGIPHSQREHS